MTLDELEKRGATCTIDEAADLLGVSRATGYEAARRGEIPVLHLGRRLIVPVCRLRALLEGTEPTLNAANAAPNKSGAAITDPRGARPPHDSRPE